MDKTKDNNTLFGPGSIIADRYEVVRTLGAGAVGMVLQVIDRSLDNEMVAIKILFPQMARDRTQFARFRNEVLVARKLAHPNIVRIYDFGEAGRGYYFISMEHIAGGSLGERIYDTRYSRPSFADAVGILYEICIGLQCAHEDGLVHRDLKPDNILLTDSGKVKISDFGLARSMVVDKGFTDTGETVGTPYYMAPEQLKGDRPGPWVDIYSLGIIAYELAVGHRPFLNENYLELARMHFEEPIPDFASKANGIPKWYEQFVKKCAAKKVSDRFASAEEAAAEIAAHANDQGNFQVKRVSPIRSLNIQSAGYSTNKKQGSFLKSSVAVLGLGAILAAGGWYNFYKPETDRKALLMAIEQSNAEMVNQLLETGVSATVENQLGKSALALAVDRGDETIVKSLIEQGADVRQRDANGKTLLMVAASRGHTALLDVFLNVPGASMLLDVDAEKRTALMHATIEKQTPFVAQLLRLKGENVFEDWKDSQGKTALIYAVESKELPLVEALLQRDVCSSVNAQDIQGNTALIYAVKGGNELIGMVEALRVAGADNNLVNNKGKSALTLARSTKMRSKLRTRPTNYSSKNCSASAAAKTSRTSGHSINYKPKS